VRLTAKGSNRDIAETRRAVIKIGQKKLTGVQRRVANSLRLLAAPNLLYNFSREVPVSLPCVWDYEMGEDPFRAILDGKQTIGRLDSDWAALRLLEYAPYAEIVRLLGFRRLISGWPRWREQIRSESRRRGFDFLATWLPEHHPELVK
jgi:hypothetical protein